VLREPVDEEKVWNPDRKAAAAVEQQGRRLEPGREGMFTDLFLDSA
jgi:hypothetical protein